MSKYNSAMDKLHVDEEMERRILKRVQASAQPRPNPFRSRRFIYTAVSAAVVLCLFFAASQLFSPSLPGYDNPPLTGPQVSVTPQMESADSLADLQQLVDFELYAPADLPEGSQAESFTCHNGQIAEVRYTGAAGAITYRTARETADNISGDYNVYQRVAEEELAGKTVTISRTGELIYLAEWSENGLSFSLSFADGAEQASVIAMLEGIAPVL